MYTPETPVEASPHSHNKELSEIGHIDLKSFVHAELERVSASLNHLLEVRHELFTINGTEFSSDLPIAQQLYDHPTNNLEFIDHDLGLRKGNALDYHQTTEKYDRGLSEEHAERDERYRQAIMATAMELGFVAKHPGEASDPIDREINILDSELEPIPEKVAAIVINGAAGMSNVKRIRDAVRNIASGHIDTDRIMLSAGTRPVNDAEKGRMKAPYRAGDSEFESMKLAVTDLLGVEFETEPITIEVPYGDALTATVESTTAVIGNKVVTIDAIEAPFDTNRVMDDGQPAKRINTLEAFLATIPLLEGKEGAIVMESHDTWTPWQNLIAHKVYGLMQDRNVYPAGPFNAERIHVVKEGDKTSIDITAPQDVVDEIVKTYRQLVAMHIELNS